MYYEENRHSQHQGYQGFNEEGLKPGVFSIQLYFQSVTIIAYLSEAAN